MTTTPAQSADLIIKLYELRREPKMREARAWFIGFTPESADEIAQTLIGSNNASFRMVATYWDMATSFVLNGAIDEQMFNDANGEHVAVFAKLAPFIDDFRNTSGMATYLKNLETVVMRLPNAKERLTFTRDRLKKVTAQRAAAAAAAKA